MASRKSPRNGTARAGLSGKPDRRVQRTRASLGAAMVALMQERPFESICVQDVLDRAGVGRSTFYSHYKDKDDLFTSDADQFFARIATALSDLHEPSDRVVPVAEFFAHVRDMRRLYDAVVASGKAHDNLALAQGHFARGIARRLAELPRGQAVAPAERALYAEAQAGAMLALLVSWLRRGMKEEPSALDALFHRMFWSGAD